MQHAICADEERTGFLPRAAKVAPEAPSTGAQLVLQCQRIALDDCAATVQAAAELAYSSCQTLKALQPSTADRS